MDLALLNYLQQAQQQQPQAEQQMLPQQTYNPFDSGISKAVSSARESFGMTDKQQQKALRRSMLAYADSIRQQPKVAGFMNNFAQFGQALSPALQTYDTEEDAALTANQGIANQILAYRAAEQARQDKLAESELLRELKRQQIENQSNYYQGKLGLEKEKLNNTGNKLNDKAWEIQARHNITKLVPQISQDFEKNAEVLPDIDELVKLLSSSKLAGSSKLAQIKRKIADFTGEDADTLKAENLGKFYYEWLARNTKGVLSDRDMQLYSKTFASIEKNPSASIEILNKLKTKLLRQQDLAEQKLNLFEEDQGADLSRIRSGLFNTSKQSNKTDYETQDALRVLGEEKLVAKSPSQEVKMRNPTTGTVFSVPASRIQEFLAKGLEEVAE